MDCFAALAMTGVIRHCEERSDEAIYLIGEKNERYNNSSWK